MGKQKPLEELKENLAIIICSPKKPVTFAEPTCVTSLRESSERSNLIAAHKVKQNTPLPSKSITKGTTGQAGKAAVKRAKKCLAKAKILPKPKPKASTETSVENFQFSDSMVNQCVAIVFESTWYVGQIGEIMSQNEAIVKYMSRVSSKVFRWACKG